MGNVRVVGAGHTNTASNISITVNPTYIRNYAELACWRIGHTTILRGLLTTRTDIPAGEVVFSINDEALTRIRIDISCSGIVNGNTVTGLLISEARNPDFCVNTYPFPENFVFGVLTILDDRAPGISATNIPLADEQYMPEPSMEEDMQMDDMTHAGGV